MRMILASSFSNAFLGGIAVWAFLTQGQFLVWAAIIAWGCFFHTGGTSASVRTTIAGNVWGIVCAWCAGLLLLAAPAGIPAPLWAGLEIGCVTMLMVFVGHLMGVHWKMTVVVVPACFYGAAASFAYMSQTPGILSRDVMLSATAANPLIAMPVSMAVGALLGYATGKMTVLLGTPHRTAADRAVV